MHKWILAGLLVVFSAAGCVAAEPGGDGAVRTEATPWHFVKVDPRTKHKLVELYARRWAPTGNSKVVRLEGVRGQIYQPASRAYASVHSRVAYLDERSGALFSGSNLTLTNLP